MEPNKADIGPRTASQIPFLDQVIRNSFLWAGAVFTILGLGSALSLYILGQVGILPQETALLNGIFALLCGVSAITIWAAARKGYIPGPLARPLLIPLLCSPTLFFLGAEFSYATGAASYLTGPISYFYFVTILIPGFLFDRRFAIATGFLSGLGYFVVSYRSIGYMAVLSSPDPNLLRGLQTLPAFAFKAAMMVAAGYLVGSLSGLTRRLVEGIIREEGEKRALSRLFGEYVSEEVREKIMASKSELVAERAEVVVLFCDLRGFSSYAEGRDPREVFQQLNEYFEGMVDAISASGGVVDKFIGDAIMAVFGGLVPLEDPQAKALEAAQRMQRTLRALNRKWAAEGKPAFENGVGLHVGPVVQGPLGSQRRKEYTVIGDAVNIAARVEGLCKDRGEVIILTQPLFDALQEGERSLCRHLGQARVKGRREPVSIYGVDKNKRKHEGDVAMPQRVPWDVSVELEHLSEGPAIAGEREDAL